MGITELIEGLKAFRYMTYKFNRENKPDIPVSKWVEAYGDEVREYETLYQLEKESEIRGKT